MILLACQLETMAEIIMSGGWVGVGVPFKIGEKADLGKT